MYKLGSPWWQHCLRSDIGLRSIYLGNEDVAVTQEQQSYRTNVGTNRITRERADIFATLKPSPSSEPSWCCWLLVLGQSFRKELWTRWALELSVAQGQTSGSRQQDHSTLTVHYGRLPSSSYNLDDLNKALGPSQANELRWNLRPLCTAALSAQSLMYGGYVECCTYWVDTHVAKVSVPLFSPIL